MTPVKYPVALRLLHWVMALIILGMIAVGWYMAGLPKEAPNKLFFYPWHKSFGVLILLLVMVRLAIRLRSQVPELPVALAAWEKRLAWFSHRLFYVLMILVPLAGYTMSCAGGHPVNFFGTELPALVPENEPLAEFAHMAHAVLAFTLLGVMVLHVAGTIKHRWVDRDPSKDVLSRML